MKRRSKVSGKHVNAQGRSAAKPKRRTPQNKPANPYPSAPSEAVRRALTVLTRA
jgi:hypothetical protein